MLIGLSSSLKKYDFEIAIDSQEDTKKCTERSCAPFIQPPPVLASCVTTVVYQRQEMGTLVYSDFTI